MIPVSVAPMMDRTDAHFRVFMRGISPSVLLYTEMVTTGAVLHGDRARLLAYADVEHPIALQLGGDDPGDLATAARIAEDLGYDEVNLNVGCPSSRVQAGSFGASLMLRPHRVAEAVAAMREAVAIEVTVKHRIGVDDHDAYEHLLHFVDTVAEAGCRRFSVHARKAWLKGLSPKENREIPPLRYGAVHRLKRERPQLHIEINGGVRTLHDVAAQLTLVDAVMIGRAAWDDPWLFASVEREVLGGTPAACREDVAWGFLPYLESAIAKGHTPHHVSRCLLNLYAGQPGARRWRRTITEGRGTPQAVRAALQQMQVEAA